jgi:hypothetical protein
MGPVAVLAGNPPLAVLAAALRDAGVEGMLLRGVRMAVQAVHRLDPGFVRKTGGVETGVAIHTVQVPVG